MKKTRTNESNNLQNVGWHCDTLNILKEIRMFMRDNYLGICLEEDDRLVLKLINGQKFSIKVAEII